MRFEVSMAVKIYIRPYGLRRRVVWYIVPKISEEYNAFI